MAVSGTIATTTFDTAKVIETALRMCRVPPQRISGELTTLARDSLFLVLSELASHGFKLWTTERVVLPLKEGYSYVEAPAGTLEVRDVNLRRLAEVTGTETSGGAVHTIAFDEAETITTLGFQFSAAGTLDLVIEVSADGSSWSTALDIASDTYETGRWYWFDIEGALSREYIRLRSTSGAFTLSDIFAGNTPQEIPLGTMNRNIYAAMTNKTVKGRPAQYWLQRNRDDTKLYLWPSPDATHERSNQIVCYRDRHIMDVGTLTQTLDIPQAWYNAVCAMLAVQLALTAQEVDPARYAVLKPVLDEKLAIAKANEGSRADIEIEADIRAYTRRR